VVDQDSGDPTFRTGDNTVRGNAFSAFAGVLTQNMNTGVNSNAQAATNIAARGTVQFGDNTGGGTE
jgi:hypothetical protein